jgi:putative endonuclease
MILERNFANKFGEIDIIAVKDSILHFIEVKCVYINGNTDKYRPEENVNELKLRKLRRVIQTYINQYNMENSQFKFHVITVKIDNIKNKYYIKMLENIIL